MSRWPRWIKIAIAAFVGLVFLVLLARIAVFRYYERELQRESVLLKADGGDTDLAALVERLRPSSTEPHEALDLADFDCRPPRGSQNVATVNFADPAVSSPDKAYAAYSAFTGYLSDNLTRTSASAIPGKRLAQWDYAAMPFLGAWLDANSDRLERIKSAARAGTGRFPIDWNKYPFDMPFRSTLRQAAFLLSADAVRLARAGDMPAAFEDVRLIYRLGRLLDNEPVTNSRLAAFACDLIAAETLQIVLDYGNPGPESVRALLDELQGRDVCSDATDVLLCETAVGLRHFEAQRRDSAYILYHMEPLLVGEDVGWRRPPPDSFPDHLALNAFRAAFDFVWIAPADEANYIRAMRGVISDSRTLPPEAIAATDFSGRCGNQSICNLLTTSLAPSSTRHLGQFARHAAYVRMARTVLALSLYKADIGGYPDSLDALVPSYLPELQLDPYDGQPLRYKLTPTGYVVYSVYDNGKDEGGTLWQDIPWERDDVKKE